MFKIVLSKGAFQRIVVSLEKDGKKLSPYHADVPTQLRSLVIKPSTFSSIETAFIQFLKNEDTQHPIVVKSLKERVECVWDPKYIIQRYISVDRSGSIVKVSRSGKKESKLYLLGGELVINLDTHKMGRFEDDEGWELWSTLGGEKTSFGSSQDALLLPKETFFFRTKTDIRFFQEGNETSAKTSDASYQLNIQEHGKKVLMVPRIKVGVNHFQIDQDEATHLVTLDEDEWVNVALSPEKEKEIIKILKETFQLEIEVNSDGFQIEVPKDSFFKHLEPLKVALEDLSVQLVFNEKNITLTQWDVTLDLQDTQKNILDQIKINGEKLDTKKIALLQQELFMVEDDSVIQMLDEQTREKIKALINILPFHEDGKVEKSQGFEHLQILDLLYLQEKGIAIQMQAGQKDVFEKLIDPSKRPDYPLPKIKKIKPRSYQVEGYQWLRFLYESKLGGILADDMGLGKTLQALMLLASLEDEAHLIVVPSSLIFNWAKEIKSVCPHLKLNAIMSQKELPEKIEKKQIYLTSYEMIRRNSEWFLEETFDVAIFDEAQMVKNIQASRSQAAKKIKSNVSFCLTGTPLENHLTEYFTLVDLCLPGLLGSYKWFKTMATQFKDNLEPLVIRTQPFVLRRVKEKMLSSFPKKQENDVYLSLSDEQKGIYQTILEQVKSTIDTAFKTKAIAQARIIALTALLRLRQVCISPQLIDPKFSDKSPKFTYLAETLDELYQEGHSVLIFSQFTKALDLLQNELSGLEIPVFRMDGKTPTKKREKIVNGFQNSDNPSVFLLSLKVGGVGLNLTRASYVYHLDPWWNPAVENQATDRVHRIGQTQSVFVNRLIMHDTVEEKLMSIKKEKKALFDQVLSGDKSADLKKMNWEDFQLLLTK